MKVFRISNPLHIKDISGRGAEIHGYRWNHVGTPLLYTAGSMALAAWEVRVHIPNNIIPRKDAFAVIEFEIPDELIVDLSQICPVELPLTWRDNQLLTKEIGTKWVASEEFLCLKVPSAVINSEYNFLINPRHVEINQIAPGLVKEFTFDERTFATLPTMSN